MQNVNWIPLSEAITKYGKSENTIKSRAVDRKYMDTQGKMSDIRIAHTVMVLDDDQLSQFFKKVDPSKIISDPSTDSSKVEIDPSINPLLPLIEEWKNEKNDRIKQLELEVDRQNKIINSKDEFIEKMSLKNDESLKAQQLITIGLGRELQLIREEFDTQKLALLPPTIEPQKWWQKLFK
jgi:hypothetical protein